MQLTKGHNGSLDQTDVTVRCAWELRPEIDADFSVPQGTLPASAEPLCTCT